MSSSSKSSRRSASVGSQWECTCRRETPSGPRDGCRQGGGSKEIASSRSITAATTTMTPAGTGSVKPKVRKGHRYPSRQLARRAKRSPNRYAIAASTIVTLRCDNEFAAVVADLVVVDAEEQLTIGRHRDRRRCCCRSGTAPSCRPARSARRRSCPGAARRRRDAGAANRRTAHVFRSRPTAGPVPSR